MKKRLAGLECPICTKLSDPVATFGNRSHCDKKGSLYQEPINGFLSLPIIYRLSGNLVHRLFRNISICEKESRRTVKLIRERALKKTSQHLDEGKMQTCFPIKSPMPPASAYLPLEVTPDWPRRTSFIFFYVFYWKARDEHTLRDTRDRMV